MTAIVTPAAGHPAGRSALPDHTQLPDEDGSFVQNFAEHPQSTLLDAIEPLLERRHADGQFCLGHDCGIYWKITDPPLDGCKAPDWFYVPEVPPTLKGEPRRSYVLWQEIIAPLILIELVSGDGSEERDRTPWQGKFWVYERAIKPAFYAIYERDPGRVEVYHLIEERFERLLPNERGHYPIAPLGVELGIWQGRYKGLELPWLRWWDAQGQLLLTPEERAEQAQQQTEQERLAKEQAQQQTEQERLAKEQAQQQADQERLAKEQAQQQVEQERLRAERLVERLRALGLDPEQI
jgi:Uma2 family endonuclease